MDVSSHLSTAQRRERQYVFLAPHPDLPTDSYLGEVIQRVRIDAGVTRRQIARRLGLCEAGIGHIETGRQQVHLWKWNILIRELPDLSRFEITTVRVEKRRRKPGVWPRQPHLGVFIKKARLEATLTQDQLSALMGIARSNIAQIEAGLRPVSFKRWDVLIRLLPALLSVSVRPRKRYIELATHLE